MSAILDTVISFIANHALQTAISILALAGTALGVYAREQFRSGAIWALAPLTRILPWNAQKAFIRRDPHGLVSEFSLVDVFLCDADGNFARYQKTSNYMVTDDALESYQEGVTAEGYADSFVSLRGTVAETAREHGFYISRIDLAESIPKGFHFTNVYAADLHGCFKKYEEHWTQEIALSTKHLTLQIHFPERRPPKFLRCKTVEGTVDKPAKTSAKIVDLFGTKSIVWEIDNPTTKEIFKLEWAW